MGSSAVAVGLGLWLAPRLPLSARRPALAAVALALLGLAGWTLRENAHWRTEEQLWRHVARCEPRSFTAHMNVGGYEKLAGSHARALAHFDRAVALEPDRAVAHFNRGTVLYALGRQGEAGEAFQRAAELGLREARVALQSLDR